ncbi:MAG: iron ABC transporter permease [bacterium]|nr:iron ABC transporter permease [bacterium]MDE0600422.1 iron ABC transporter permease [bacterium]
MMGVARPVPRLRALPPNTWWWVLAGVVMLPAAAPLGVLAYGLVSGVVTTVPVGRLLELAANTGALAGAVTATSLIIGGASAWLVSRTDLPGKRLATVLVITPFAVPSFVGALTLLGATGADGILSAVFTWLGGGAIGYPSGFWAAWLVLSLISVPLVHLAVTPAMHSLNPSLEEAARGLGAGRLKVFWTVTLPQLRPSLTAGALLVGLYTLSDFGAVSLLRYDTFTRAIYLEYAGRIDRRPALGLAAVLAAVAVILVWVERSTRAKGVWFTARPRRTAPPVRLGRFGKVIGWGFLGSLVTLSLLIPIAVLSAWMLRGLLSGTLVDAPWAEVGRSIWVAVLAASVAALAVTPLAMVTTRYRNRWAGLLEGGAWSLYGVPHIATGMAMIVFSLRLARPLYQTLALLIGVYVIMFLPQILGPSRDSLGRVSPSMEEASRSLGRSPARTFMTVTLPLMAPGLLSGAALVFLTTLRELPATLLLRPAGFETLAIRVWSATGEGFYTQGAVAGLLLLLIAALPLAVVARHELIR